MLMTRNISILLRLAKIWENNSNSSWLQIVDIRMKNCPSSSDVWLRAVYYLVDIIIYMCIDGVGKNRGVPQGVLGLCGHTADSINRVISTW